MSAYGEFARYYDALTGNVDYKARGEYLLSLFDKYGKRPKSLLDLACGTGKLMEIFAEKGIDLIGVDASSDMLSVATERLRPEYPSALLLCQPMALLDLSGTVEGGVSTLYSLNHLVSLKEIAAVFSRLKFFIQPGGLFVFDMNTPFKHKNILGNNSFVLETKEVFCVWQNEFYEKESRVDISLDLFTPLPGGNWRRSSEEFSERAYENREIISAAEQNGFEFIALCDDMRFDPPQADSERVVFVIKRKEI